MGVRDRLTQLVKTFGTAVPGRIQAAELSAGMGPTRPFSPGEPIGPYDGYSRTPRSRDFVTGYNIATRPRTHERVSFDTLKGLVEAYDVAQMAIWHRIDSIRALDWSLVPARGFSGDADDAIALGLRVLEKPDRQTPFANWLAKWLYDVLAYDAGTLYRLRNRRGDVIGLATVDGTSVAPLLDYWGNTPKAPAEAYVQYIQGLPWNWLTTDDLIYQPFRPRTNSPYGTAPLETILLNANTDLRFQQYFLQRFTEGNLPSAFASAPETWTPDQIESFQEYWDAAMVGDQAAKHQIKWMPGGSKIGWSNEKDFSDQFSLFLMRKTAAAFHVVPADLGFTENVNKSSGESQGDVQHRVGELPLVAYVQGILTHFLRDDLGLPVEFSFDTGQEKEDRLQEAQAWQIYVETGAASSDEMREKLLGLPGDPRRPTPRFFSTTRLGPVPLLAIQGVAGKVDPESYGPADDQPVLYQPYVPPPGVVPAEGTTDAKASMAAEDAYQTQVRQELQTQHEERQAAREHAVAKDGPAVAPTTGVTSETGIVGYDLVGHKPDEEDEDEDAEELVKAELAAFRSFRKGRVRAGKWRDFEFRHIGPEVGRQLNHDGRQAVHKAAVPKGDAPGKGAHHWPGWALDERCADYWATQITTALTGALTARRADRLAADYRAQHPNNSEADKATLLDEARVWLAGQDVDLTTPLTTVLSGMYTDGYLIGITCAHAVVDGQRPKLGGWKPGDTDTAQAVIDSYGAAEDLAELLDTVPDMAREMADTRLDDLARELVAGLLDDTAVAKSRIGTALRNRIGNLGRAAATAITEITRASGIAAIFGYRQRKVAYGRWEVDPASNVCPTCNANAEAGPIPIGEPYPSGDVSAPAHPNCFPAGVVVTGPSTVAATARRYEGDLVTIVLSGGEEVPVTPNHPVLTPNGWVAAGDLNKGVEVLRARDAERVAALVYPDDRQAVSRIEDVAATLGEARPVMTMFVPVTAEDFHGDGSGDDKVDVVLAAGHCQFDRVPALAHEVGELDFVSATRTPLLAGGEPDAVLCGLGLPGGFVRRCEHGFPLLGGRALPADGHSGRSVAAVDSPITEHPVDRVPIESVLPGHGFHGHSAEVVVDETVRGRDASRVGVVAATDRNAASQQVLPEGFTADATHGRAVSELAAAHISGDRAVQSGRVNRLTAQRETGGLNLLTEGLSGDAGDGRALIDRLSGLVSVERVSEVRRQHGWVGHVYNLQTVDGWYFANGIIAHNCRCAVAP